MCLPLVVVLLTIAVGGVIVYAKTLVDCGGEGERPCGIFDDEYYANGHRACDRGLALAGGTCENFHRRIARVDPWIDWALRNQEKVAIDEPINWTSRMATHNANNNWADGGLVPNQYWSLTDQLRLGSRHFQLDLHWLFDQVRLCHGTENNFGCPPDARLYAYGIKEIRNWLASQPDQVLTIDFEDRADHHTADVEEPLEEYFGNAQYKPGNYQRLGRLPTAREMAGPHFGPVRADQQGRVLILDPYDQYSGDLLFGNHTFSQKSGLITNPDTGAPNLAFNPVGRDCRTGVSTWGSNGPGTLPGLDVFTFPWSNPKDRFAWIAEDRLFGTSWGLVDEGWVEFAVRCRISLIFLDQFAQPEHTGDTEPADFRHRSAIWSWEHNDFGHFGDAALLLRTPEQSTPSGLPWNYWASRSPTVIRPFACARARSESGGDPNTWPDKPGHQWKVTEGAGTWFEGGRQCLEEFGENWVFSVPRNGYQNVQLSNALGPTDVWLNYNDVRTEGQWIINRRPVADAGPDQTLQCTAPGGALATLDGSASHDSLPPPHGDPDYSSVLYYDWPEVPGSLTSPTRNVLLPAGSHTFRLVVDDRMSGVDQDDTTVHVVDTLPPVIESTTASPSSLWPPDGRMVPVTLSVGATDACSLKVRCEIVSVTSNESNPAEPRGKTWKIGSDHRVTGPLSVLLRSRRLDSGSGRTYTLQIRCTDRSGNISENSVTVNVPLSQP